MDRLKSLTNEIKEQRSELVLVEIRDNIAIVSMNDTRTFNSLGKKMINTLSKLLMQLSNAEEVRVIVLRSNAKIFCSGANIKEFQSMDLKETLRFDNYLWFKKIFQLISKPIIAVVNDIAYGGGFELALMCDIIISHKTAKFGFPELNLGLIPGIGGTIIAKTIGRFMANKLIFTGEPIQANKAKDIGLLWEVLETKEEALEFALNLATKLKNKSIYALIVAKRAIRFSAEESGFLAMEQESTLFNQLLDTEGCKEGVSAFVDKRKADFKNK